MTLRGPQLRFEDYVRHTPDPLDVRPVPTDKIVHLRIGDRSFRTTCGLSARESGWRITHDGLEKGNLPEGWTVCEGCQATGYVRLRVLLAQAKGEDLTRRGLWVTGATRKRKRAGRLETDGAFRERCLKRLDEKWWAYP